MKIHRFQLSFETWEVQKAITKILISACLIALAGIVYQSISNRYLSRQINTQKVYLYENQHIQQIQSVQDGLTSGDDFIIQKYLKTFILLHERRDLENLKAFTNPFLFSKWRRFKQSNQIVQIKIISTEKLDDNLIQMEYISQTDENIEKKVALIQWKLLTQFPENDIRLGIENVDVINPLRLEVTEYNSVTKLD